MFYGKMFNVVLNPEQLNKKSLAATIMRFSPRGTTPLFAMTSMLKDSKAVASTHGYFTKSLEFPKLTAPSMDESATTGTFKAEELTSVVAGQIFFNPKTRENLRVEAIAGTTVTFHRGIGRVSAAAIDADTQLVNIGTAYEEGSKRPTAVGLVSVYASNFTQIFRNAWAITDTARASAAELGFSNVAESRADCATFHALDIEKTLFLGQPKMTQKNGQPFHTTQGIVDAVHQYAPNNVVDLAVAAVDGLGYDEFTEILNPIFAVGSADRSNPTHRIAFCGQKAMQTFQSMGREYADVSVGMTDAAFGQVFTDMKWYKGTVSALEHPLLNVSGMEDAAVIVDVPSMALAYMDGRKQKEELFQQGGSHEGNSGVDGQGGSLTSEFALELMNPSGCAVISGFTGKAKPKTTHVYVENKTP